MTEGFRSGTGLPGERVLRRILALTLGFGFAAAAAALVEHRSDWARGLAGGALLGWLNFRWLSRGVRSFMSAAGSSIPETGDGAKETAQPRKSGGSPAGAQITLLLRYALVAAGVYVIFTYLHAPLVSIGLGLCALVAAIITASLWEVLKPEL